MLENPTVCVCDKTARQNVKFAELRNEDNSKQVQHPNLSPLNPEFLNKRYRKEIDLHSSQRPSFSVHHFSSCLEMATTSGRPPLTTKACSAVNLKGPAEVSCCRSVAASIASRRFLEPSWRRPQEFILNTIRSMAEI